MLLGITNGGKLGLGLVAGLFIVFAILSSFYFPRRDPNFPGNRLGAFVAVAALLFVLTMAGVVVFARRRRRARGESPPRRKPASPETTTEAGGGGRG